MGKTLVIRGADFEAVKVGTVEIPRELSPEALAWIEASGNTSLTDTQKGAIDDFIASLKTSGVYDKLDKIHLPMLAASKVKAFVEYKTLTDESIQQFQDVYTFRNHGILSEAGVSQFAKIDASYVKNSGNIGLYVFTTEDFSASNTGNNYYNSVGPENANAVELCLGVTTTALQMISYLNGTNVAVNDTTSNWQKGGFRGFSANGTSISYLKQGGTFGTQNYPSEYTQKDYTGYSLTGLNNNSHTQRAAAGAFFVGDALSDTEATSLRTAILALWEAINV